MIWMLHYMSKIGLADLLFNIKREREGGAVRNTKYIDIAKHLLWKLLKNNHSLFSLKYMCAYTGWSWSNMPFSNNRV